MYLFLVLLALFSVGCTTHPPTEKSNPNSVQRETLSPIETIPLDNISATASISAKMRWCGNDYIPFYLASMQFERLTPRPQPDYAYLGVYHGALMQREFTQLNETRCSEKDAVELKNSYEELLKKWCVRKSEIPSIMSICEDGVAVFK